MIREKRKKITLEDEKIHRPVIFQLRRVVSFVLQYKLSKGSIISDIVSTIVFLKEEGNSVRLGVRED